VKEAEKVLVAVGRAPRRGIGLEKTKIELERGFVKVNEAQETAEPGVFAIGDIVAGLPQLAHVGAMSGMVAMAKIAGASTGRCGAIGFRLHLYRAADRQRGP
jgi:dihydrolipoamide dehydrogenase